MKIHGFPDAGDAQGGPGARRWDDVWQAAAPAAVRRAYRLGRVADGWEAWVRHLAGRTRPVPLAGLFPGEVSPLGWAGPGAGPPMAEGAIQVEEPGREPRSGGGSVGEAARRWLRRPPETVPERAIEALGWCHALPQLAASLADRLWWDLLDRLVQLAVEAGGIQLEELPLVHQLLAGELPLTLAYLFPEIRACRKLARPARRALRAGLIELCDGEGTLHGRWLDLLRPLLACWTRCRTIGDRCRKGPWAEDAQVQYEWFIRGAIRLTRGDGSAVFSLDGASGSGAGSVRSPKAWCGGLFAAALAHGGNRQDRVLAALVLPGSGKGSDRRGPAGRLPSPAEHSEWAATATLRTGWEPDAPRLTAVWADPAVRIELECKTEVIFSGPWPLVLRYRDRRVEQEGPWEEVCWVSDEDGDYLELEGEFSEGVRVQRQLFLARKDRFLLLADAVMAKSPGGLEYRQALPLRPGITFEPGSRTCEGHLVGSKRRALVLPLGLPEWRVDPPGGSLQEVQGQLVLQQATPGTALLAPLWLDLKPRRMVRRCTWRQLTVAQDRQVLPRDAAVGYRAMVGKQQWLIYRSLGPPGNRTLLGHNLVTEFLVARFRQDGEVKPLVEIE